MGGYALAPGGVFAVLFAPVVGRAIGKGVDPRLLATIGFLTFALTGYWRSTFNTGADFATIMLPQWLQGVGVAFFLRAAVFHQPERHPARSGSPTPRRCRTSCA